MPLNTALSAGVTSRPACRIAARSFAADGSTTIPCFGTIHTDLTDTCGSQVTSHGPGILVLSSFWEQKTESTSVFAQQERARLQILFLETEWSEAYRDTIEWEVWAEPEDKCSCWDYSATKEEKEE